MDQRLPTVAAVARCCNRLQRRHAGMRRTAVRSVAVTGIVLIVCSCGGSDRTTSEVLRSANLLTRGSYLEIRGPAGAVSQIARRVMTAGYFRYSRGFFVPPRLHRRVQHGKICSITHTIGPADSPNLQAWRGKKLTVTVDGNPFFCSAIPGLFTSGY